MPAPVRQEIRDAAVADYEEGMTSEQVAEKHGVSGSSVLVWVRSAGISVRQQGNPTPPDGPIAYTGGWVQDGLIRRPKYPRQNRISACRGVGTAWDNGTARTGALTPAGPNHRYDSTQPRSEG